MNKKWIRARAIFYAVLYGVLPYWIYETTCHYDCSYWGHLMINIRYAWRWITGDVDESDYQFEKDTNSNAT